MKAAIITIAGISSRFNENIPEEEKVLKGIYFEGNPKDTLLYHLVKKCAFADCIILVCGYKSGDLEKYVSDVLLPEFPQILIVKNDHYADLNSGYSFYMGLLEAFRLGAEEVLFAEGDLDLDEESFEKIVQTDANVLTLSPEPIYAKKAVVLYQNGEGLYRYAFNSSHGLLQIEEPFSCIFNSGQCWKFTDMQALKTACEDFGKNTPDGTNLVIIQNYLSRVSGDIQLIGFQRWTNCNTREDYRKIKAEWEKRN